MSVNVVFISESGKSNLRADSFTSLLREEVPAYPVYIRPRRKTMGEMSVEEIFELARNFRRSKRSQNDIVGSGAYDIQNEVPRCKSKDPLNRPRLNAFISAFPRVSVSYRTKSLSS